MGGAPGFAEEHQAPQTFQGPTRAASRSGGGLLCLPEKTSTRSTPSLSPGLPYTRGRPNPGVLSRFRCKRGEGPGALGAGTAGERGRLGGCSGDPQSRSGLRALLCTCSSGSPGPKVGPKGQNRGAGSLAPVRPGGSLGTALFTVPAKCTSARDWRGRDSAFFVAPPNKNK